MSDTTDDSDTAAALRRGDLVVLERVEPARNAYRAYRLVVWPDLFSGAVLVREYGRIGRGGRMCFAPYPDADRAAAAGVNWARAKKRRGYKRVQQSN
jgi:predicted DNA-binding WGR domain protein